MPLTRVRRAYTTTLIVSLFALCLGVSAAFAPHVLGQSLRPINVGFSGIGMQYLPAYIAEAEGFTRKHGLDVTYISLSGGTPTVQALMAGEYSLAVSSTTMMHAHVQGFDPVMIATFTPYMPFHFVARGDIKSAEDLRGKRAAISTPGSVTDGVVRLVLRQLGLTPERDVAIISIGNESARLAAIEAGTADATLLSPPLSYQLIEQGYTMIVDLMAQRIPNNHEGVITTHKVLTEDPDLLKRYIRAISEALHYIHTNPEGTIRHAATFLQLDLEENREILERTYEEFTKYNYAKIPYPLVQGWRNALEIGSLLNPAVLELDPWDLMDVRIVRELEEEGFFDALYE